MKRAYPSTWEKLEHEVKIVHYLVQKPWRAPVDALGRLGEVVGRLFRRPPGEVTGVAAPPARDGGLVVRHARALARGVRRPRPAWPAQQEKRAVSWRVQ